MQKCQSRIVKIAIILSSYSFIPTELFYGSDEGLVLAAFNHMKKLNTERWKMYGSPKDYERDGSILGPAKPWRDI
jgi:hypothetical protein